MGSKFPARTQHACGLSRQLERGVVALALDIGLRSLVSKAAFTAQTNNESKPTRQLGSCKQAWLTPAVEIYAAP